MEFKELEGFYKCPVCTTRNSRLFLYWSTREDTKPKSTLSHWCEKCGAIHKINYYIDNKEGFKLKVLLFECNGEVTKHRQFKLTQNQ